jgi:hypothetical protein
MSRAVIVVHGRADREKAAHWAQVAPDGCVIEFRQSRRTLDQNARLWACLTEIARNVEWHGMKLPADDWKDIFTAALRRHRFVPGIEANTVVPLGMRTSDMTKQEFSDLLELINAFAAERGIVFKDTDQPGASTAAPAEGSEDGGASVLAPADTASGGPAEPGEAGIDAADSGSDLALMSLKRECLDKFLRVATDERVPEARDRRGNLETVKDAWKAELPQDLEFVKACFVTADKIVKGELPADKARAYLEGMV